MNWITDWSEIWDDEMYIVCAVNASFDREGQLFLSRPQLLKGWQVKRLMAKCYAALPMPEFKGLP